MGRIFRDEEFAKRSRKAGISSEVLKVAVNNAEAGLIAARLGGGLVKIRVARPGRGKSSGFRTILAFKSDERAFFIHLFAKNEVDNIDNAELADLKDYAKILLEMTEAEISRALSWGALEEIL